MKRGTEAKCKSRFASPPLKAVPCRADKDQMTAVEPDQVQLAVILLLLNPSLLLR